MRRVPPSVGGGTGSERRTPTPMRTLLRLPHHLYANDLGWALGGRFLQLTHTGRRSGRRHTTVLEVVDRTPAGELVVVSGLGPHADWLRNLRAGGPAHVTVGRRVAPVSHRLLDIDEAAATLADYEHRHRALAPLVRRVLSMLLGWRYRGTVAQRRRAVVQLPLIALRPTTPLSLSNDAEETR